VDIPNIQTIEFWHLRVDLVPIQLPGSGGLKQVFERPAGHSGRNGRKSWCLHESQDFAVSSGLAGTAGGRAG